MKSECFWNISLTVTCPKCDNFFDLTDTPDFWDGRSGLVVPRQGYLIEAECPECQHEFETTTAY